jgi:hypothetical protein
MDVEVKQDPVGKTPPAADRNLVPSSRCNCGPRNVATGGTSEVRLAE